MRETGVPGLAALDPDFKLSNEPAIKRVNISDLLAHPSGVPTGAGDVLEDLAYGRPEILSRIRLVPLAGAFRETYHYNNLGTEHSTASNRRQGGTR